MRLTVRCSFASPMLLPAVVLTCLLASVRAQSESATKKDELVRTFRAAYEKGDFSSAIEVGLELAALDSENASCAYDLGAAYAQKGVKDEALKWLRHCAERGYADIQTAKSDPAFESLRTDASFAEILDIIRQNRRDAFEEFKKEAAGQEPLVIVPPDYNQEAPAPLLIVIHDDGSTAEETAELFREPAARVGAILVAPQSTRRAEGHGFRWERPSQGDYMVTMALNHGISHYNIDPRKRIVAGVRQGATTAMIAASKHPFEIGAAIAVSPKYDPMFAPPPDPMRSPVPKYYLVVGEEDEALEDARLYKAEYGKKNVRMELKIVPGLKQGLPENASTVLRLALRHVLSPGT